jgi:L-seryl-tRNA(Ser) seleniumtransferase
VRTSSNGCARIALQATLALYLDPERARREIPVLRMLSTPVAELDLAATRIVAAFATRGIPAAIMDGDSAVGGGALPGAVLPTRLVVITTDVPAHILEQRLRSANTPVIARIIGDRLCLDPRTIAPEEVAALVAALEHALV